MIQYRDFKVQYKLSSIINVFFSKEIIAFFRADNQSWEEKQLEVWNTTRTQGVQMSLNFWKCPKKFLKYYNWKYFCYSWKYFWKLQINRFFGLWKMSWNFLILSLRCPGNLFENCVRHPGAIFKYFISKLN